MSWRDTWLAPRAWEVALGAFADAAQNARNPSSLHRAGRAAKRTLDELHESLCVRIGATLRDVDVIVTGGAVEAMELVSVDVELGERSSALSRAVLGSCVRTGAPTSQMAVLVDDRDATLDPHAAGTARGEKCARVTDATLALGRMDLDFDSAGSDVWVVAGEYSGAPPGIAAIVRRRGAPIRPRWGGGGQEHGVRAGTQAVALAAAWSASLRADARRAHLREVAARVAGVLDSLGLKILSGRGTSPQATADGIVIAEGDVKPVLEALERHDVWPWRLGDTRIRFALDASDSDDDTRDLVSALESI